jgi:small subunit ribosomal protein S13
MGIVTSNLKKTSSLVNSFKINMAHLLESVISDNKIINISLHQIYGIGINRSRIICKNNGLTDNFRTFELRTSQSRILKRFIQKEITVESDLKKSVSGAKQRLLILRTNRGIRAKQGFPVRGQRTHTNGKTAKKKIK